MPEPLRRRFFAHLRDDERCKAQAVPHADSPLEAAILFLENWLPEGASEDEGVAVIVEDCETGRQMCFTVDLADGKAEPC